MGRLDETARWYASFAEHSDFDLIYLAAGLVHRGRILETIGRTAEAAGVYRQAADLLDGSEGPWAVLEEQAGRGVRTTEPRWV